MASLALVTCLEPSYFLSIVTAPSHRSLAKYWGLCLQVQHVTPVKAKSSEHFKVFKYFSSIWNSFSVCVIMHDWELEEAFPFCELQPLSVYFHQNRKALISNGLTFVWLKRDRRQLLGSGGGFHVYWISLCHDYKCYSQESCREAIHFRCRPCFPNAHEVIMVTSWYFPLLHQYVWHFWFQYILQSDSFIKQDCKAAASPFITEIDWLAESGYYSTSLTILCNSMSSDHPMSKSLIALPTTCIYL